MTQVQIAYQRTLKDADGIEFLDRDERSTYDTFGIPESYTRTSALLKEWGLYDAICKPEDISYIELEFDYRGDEKVKIEDAEEIKEIYKFISESKYISGISRDYNNHAYNIRVTFFDGEGKMLFDSHDLRSSIIPLPEIVEVELKRFALKNGIDYDNDNPQVIVEKAEMY